MACEAFMPRALAWDGEGPLLKRWFSTAWAFSVRPVATLANAPREGSVASSFAFALVAGAVGWLPTWLLYGALMGMGMLAGQASPYGAMAGPLTGAVLTTTLVAFYGLGSVAGTLLSAALVSLAEHALVGGFSKGTAWTVSLRAHALSYAPALAGLLPCCGWPAMLLGSVPLRVLAMERFHGCTRARATVAVLTPVAVVLIGVAMLAALVTALVMAFAKGIGDGAR